MGHLLVTPTPEQLTVIVNFQETTVRHCLQSGTAADLSESERHNAVTVTFRGTEETSAVLDIPWTVRNNAVRLTVSSETQLIPTVLMRSVCIVCLFSFIVRSRY